MGFRSDQSPHADTARQARNLTFLYQPLRIRPSVLTTDSSSDGWYYHVHYIVHRYVSNKILPYTRRSGRAWTDGRTCREAAFWRPKCLTLATNDTRIAT